MSSQKIIILVAILLFCASLTSALIDAATDAESDGTRHDSFGVYPNGIRGVYETMESLQYPVARSYLPPHIALRNDPNATLVLWHSNQSWQSMEPTTLKQSRMQLQSSGKIVIGLPFNWLSIYNPFLQSNSSSDYYTHYVHTSINDKSEKNATDSESLYETESQRLQEALHAAIHFVPKALGINDFTAYVVTFQQSTVLEESLQPFSVKRLLYFLGVQDRWKSRLQSYRSYPVQAEGSLSPLQQHIGTLALPVNTVQTLVFNATQPTGRRRSHQFPVRTGTLSILDHNHTVHHIAASYKIGNGECIIISDPSLFTNALLGKYDNAALAAGILPTGNGSTIIFDEFFNGLSVRGNPLWLFVQTPYSFFFLALLLFIIAIGWRTAPRLGSALDPIPVKRRAIEEYIDAMSQLHYRADSHVFLLQQVRAGVLWSLRRQLHLGPGTESPEVILAALHKRDPSRATRLRTALDMAETYVTLGHQPTESQMILAAKEMTACL